jgi:hypothetical protein
MLSVNEILTDKVTLDIECVDRVYLNGYVKVKRRMKRCVPIWRGSVRRVV